MNTKTNNILSYCVFFVFLTFFTVISFAQTEKSTIKTVVIDAGHGGKDPGCHGKSAHEKNVCLSMALKLGEAIKAKYPSINVIYTRDTDVFVELDERANIANRNKADLFICIHANSAAPAAFGTETYVLGLHKTEAQRKIAEQVAERENASIYLEDDKGAKYKSYDLSPEAMILKQLELSVYLDQSIVFATKLQNEFKKIGRSDRGVRQAGFLVLYKTTMPSVLIETGFLTNEAEEKFLADTTSQQKMATAMFTAFEQYKNQIEGVAAVSTTKAVEPANKVTQTETEKNKIPADNKVYFKVQIETSDKRVSTTDSRFNGMNVFEYQQNNLFKYTVGNFENDFQAAEKYKNELKEKGYQHAFVVAFMNGERINLEKAIKLAEK